MKNDDLGNRMKKYEEVSKHRLLSRTPVLIRVDGRAFHTFTKGYKKPFDKTIIDAMVYATEMTAKELGGFELAYVQSDEATFFIQDYETYATQGWFDYEINKIVSITASTFSVHFNMFMLEVGVDDHTSLAVFDARVFNVPYDDVPNAFIWRQKDWIRNSVQMLGQYKFGHKQLQGLDNESVKALLIEAGSSWEELTEQEKYGTFIYHDEQVNKELSWNIIRSLMTKPKDE